jgi:hypothetical protein
MSSPVVSERVMSDSTLRMRSQTSNIHADRFLFTDMIAAFFEFSSF